MNHFQRMYDQTVKTVDGLTNGFNGQDDRLRQEGTTSTLNGKEVKWNKGQWVASSDYKEPKLLEVERENISNGVQTVANGIVNGDLGNGTLNGYRDKVVDFWGGGAHWLGNSINALKNTARDAEYGNYEPNNVTELAGVGIGNALRLAEAGNEKAGDAGEYIGSALNVDPQASRFFGEEAFAAFLTAGGSVAAKQAGKIGRRLIPPSAPKLVAKSGGFHIQVAPDVTPDLSQQVFDITIKNPEFIAPGVKEGISTTGKYGKALNKWKARREYLLGELQNPSKQSAKAQKVERSKLANDLSTFNPDEEQLGFWGKGPTSKYLKMVKEQGAIPGQQAHHLFPKNESYAFVKRMAQVGDDDDLVNMFLYAEMLDAKMGGLIDNMLMMDVQPHIGKATTINGKKLEEGLHLQRQRDGREFKHRAAEQMIEFVEEAQTADELMAKFDDYIKNNILQSKSDAIRLQREFEMASRQVKEELTQLTPTLSEAQRRRL